MGRKESNMAKFEMGDMPAKDSKDEMDMMDGADYEMPEDEAAPSSDLAGQLADMSDEELDKLEADIAAERESRASEGDSEASDESMFPA